MATVSLSWTDNSDDEDGFRVYRSTTSSPSFPSDYTQIDSLAADTTTYDDTDPPLGIVVNYAVVAYNDDVESAATTDTVDLTPNAPSASNIGVSRGRNGKIGSAVANGYVANSSVDITPDKTHIYRTTVANATFPDDYTLVDSVDGEVSDFEDPDSPYGTNVFYAVTVEVGGQESSPTESDTFIPPEDAAGVNPNFDSANLNP